MAHRTLACLGGLFSALSAAAAPPAPRAGGGAPTTEQMYSTFEDGDYPKVLRQIAGALAVKGEAAAAYDRHELLALKAETFVRLKNLPAAADAFDDAARSTIVETKAAVDRSTAELLRRAKAGVYTPAPVNGAAAPPPVDVTDPLKRQDALAALFEESTAKAGAAAEAAGASAKLPAVLDALRMLYDLRVMEQAATGGEAKSAELAKPLATKARSLMARAVTDMSDVVVRMGDPAQQEYKVTASGELLRRDYSVELRQVAADCDRVGRVAADLLKNFPGDEAEALRQLRADAADVASRATWVANAQSGGYSLGEEPLLQQLQPAGNVEPGRRPRGGTNAVQRPNRGRGGAGAGRNRGVGTGGVR